MNSNEPRRLACGYRRANGTPLPLRFVIYCDDPKHQPLARSLEVDLRARLGDLALPPVPPDPDVLWKLDAPTGDFEFGLDCDDEGVDDEPIEILLDALVLDGERLERALAATRAAMLCIEGTGGLMRIHAPGAVLRRMGALHTDAQVRTARVIGRAARGARPSDGLND